MFETIVVGLAFFLVGAVSFVAGLYLAKKEIVDMDKVTLPDLPPIKPKPKGAILKPLSQEEKAIKEEEETITLV